MDRVETRFIDREISWLDFNTRVLELAEDQSIPLLERVKFLAIFHSNLDEFYMVRVASLKQKLKSTGSAQFSSGFTVSELLDEIQERVRKLNERVHFLVKEDINPSLNHLGIKQVKWDSLSKSEKKHLTKKFQDEVLPVLTPLAVDSSHPFPHISGLSLNLGISVKSSRKGSQFIRLKVPSNIKRIIKVNEIDDSYILVEDLISEHLELLLPGSNIEDFYFFRVTRNQDLDLDEEDSEDLLSSLEEELLQRKFGAPVRLEVETGINKIILEKLISELEISESDVIVTNPPLDPTLGFEIYEFDMPSLKFPIFKNHVPAPLDSAIIEDYDEFFDLLKKQEILLHHPAHSFSGTVAKFIQYAARDPKVLAIKQTLYRTSGDSPIMHALIEAAELGKQVLAVIEIRARFDEIANVRWARRLEDAGAHVIYGMLNYKTHAKASLVVRKENQEIFTYVHMGTGNYHPKTARIYDDLGLMSAKRELGEDLIALFNQLSGLSSNVHFNRILVAPSDLRYSIVRKISREIDNCNKGLPCGIRMKMNSLLDEEIIDLLYLASDAGVSIDLVIRGMCSFRMSRVARNQNVRLVSILGRFLEHSRIYHFSNAGYEEYWIGSADIMSRNLDGRVEALVEIQDTAHKESLNSLLTAPFNSDFRRWVMSENDSWRFQHLDQDGNELADLQKSVLERGVV